MDFLNLKFEFARFESSTFKFILFSFKFQSGPKPSEPNSARRGAEEPGKPGGEKEVDQVNKSAPKKICSIHLHVSVFRANKNSKGYLIMSSK